MILDIFDSILRFQKIKKKEFYPKERLRDYQWQCLKKTLQFASTQIPYYIDTYRKAGLHHEDIKTWDDFRKVPILTKQNRRSHPPEYFLPREIDKNKIWKTHTTGSSGIPITVFRDANSVAFDRALIYYSFDKLGIKVYHRFCQMVSMMAEKPHHPGPLAKLGFKRNFVVSLRDTDEVIVRQLQEIKPDVIWAFPSILLRLAEYLTSHQIQLKVRWLIAQGEVLPESWRPIIEKAFQAPLYHTYGSTEIVRMGFECRCRQGYHLIPDAAITEVVNDEKPAEFGEEGELIVTNLNNFCSPFIRYQIGDRGTLTKHACECGVTFPLLQNISGRSDDFIILPSGRKVSARAVTHMQFEGIIQYKIVQKSTSHLQVLVIPSRTYGKQTVWEINKVLAGAFMGESLKIEVIPTEFLPVSKTAKLQLVTREF